jgi:flagellar hook-associated protein 2
MQSIAATLGVGSGIDTSRLINDLAAASREPKIAALEQRSGQNRAKISALAQARSDLESFASSFSVLVAGGTLQSQPVSSNNAVLSAVSRPGARIGGFAAEIEISQLARAQSVYSAYVASATNPIGQGAMTLSVGGADYAIATDASNDSLGGLAAAINASGSGVTANVISDNNGARLVLKGAVGAAGSFTLSNASGNIALDAFSYPTGSMTLAQTAQDAAFKVDGIAYNRPSNSVEDIIPGVTLTLRQAAIGQPVSVTGQRPGETLRSTLQDFVSVFNTLKTALSTARSSNGGDQGLRGLEQQLLGLVGRAVTSNLDINSLADIGVATTRDGTLMLDQGKFDAAMRDNPDAVEALFSPTRDATRTAITDPGLSGALNALKDAAVANGGALSGLKTRLDRESGDIAKMRERIEAREAVYKDRLTRQFSGMDARVAVLKATQSYLEQQVAIWTNQN